jgi:hypothetical protein
LVFGIFATLAEFESELIRERTQAGLASARVRGRLGGRPRKLTQETLHMAMAAMADPKSNAREGPAGGNVRPSAIRAWRFPFYHTALALSLYLSRFQVHWRPKSGETMPVHAEVGNSWRGSKVSIHQALEASCRISDVPSRRSEREPWMLRPWRSGSTRVCFGGIMGFHPLLGGDRSQASRA